MGGRGRNNHRGNNHNNQNNNHQYHQNQQPQNNQNNNSPSVTLYITGLAQSQAATNPDGGVQSFRQWLEKRASRTILSHSMTGNIFSITVNSHDVSRFTHLNGFTFAGATVTVTEQPVQNGNIQPPAGPRNQQNNNDNSRGAKTATRGGQQNNNHNTNSMQIEQQGTTGADNVESALVAVIRRRYNAGPKYLNLGSLPSEAEFKEIGLSSQPASKVFSALFVCCETKVFETPLKRQQMVESLSLASNGLTTVKDCIAAAGTFNHIKNLDLSDNNITDVGELRYWRNKFPNLEHLILRGNPVDTPETATKMRLWYKTLKLYNGEPLPDAAVTAVQSTLPKPKTVGIELLPNDMHPEIPPGHDFGQVTAGKSTDLVMKEQMALRFSYETRLNIEMSQMCLQANQFDYQKAIADLTNLMSRGQIEKEKFLWTQ